MKCYLITAIICLVLTGCSHESTPTEQWLNFEGREKNLPIYRVKVPKNWQPFFPNDDAYLSDTTLPILSFRIQDEDQNLLITVHNFPTQRIEESIPAQMQVFRWQRQFEEIDEFCTDCRPVAYNGFSGLIFEGTGVMKGVHTSMLAFAMQMIPEHYRTLSNQPQYERKYKQMRSDYTIKVIGTPEAVAKQRDTIIEFAESFELIESIPSYL
ncbi:MAG: hypothetical protein ACSNEK_06930 [Parachlamydiaceae bacterium]